MGLRRVTINYCRSSRPDEAHSAHEVLRTHPSCCDLTLTFVEGRTIIAFIAEDAILSDLLAALGREAGIGEDDDARVSSKFCAFQHHTVSADADHSPDHCLARMQLLKS